MKLYEYAVIRHEKTDQAGEITDPATVVVPPQTVLARDDAQAQLLASRAIPETEITNLDRLEVVVRPFDRRPSIVEAVSKAMKKVPAFHEKYDAVTTAASASSFLYRPSVTFSGNTSGAIYATASSLLNS